MEVKAAFQDRPRKANQIIALFRLLLGYAVKLRLLRDNPDSRIGVPVIHGWSAVWEPNMVRRVSDWHDELEDWLEPFLTRLGHKARRQMCPLYVAGLIGPDDRKSVQPMAERLVPGDYDQLHHFIAAGLWDAAPLEAELLMQADRLVVGPDAVLVIDDTALPKACPRA